MGQLEDALLAVVVETREELRLCVAFLADSAGDISLQVFQTLLLMSYTFCHGGEPILLTQLKMKENVLL